MSISHHSYLCWLAASKNQFVQSENIKMATLNPAKALGDFFGELIRVRLSLFWAWWSLGVGPVKSCVMAWLTDFVAGDGPLPLCWPGWWHGMTTWRRWNGDAVWWRMDDLFSSFHLWRGVVTWLMFSPFSSVTSLILYDGHGLWRVVSLMLVWLASSWLL